MNESAANMVNLTWDIVSAQGFLESVVNDASRDLDRALQDAILAAKPNNPQYIVIRVTSDR